MSGDTAGQPRGGAAPARLPDAAAAAPTAGRAALRARRRGAGPGHRRRAAADQLARPTTAGGACIQCGACVGFGCPGEFKNGTHNTVIPRALATGRCDVLTARAAERVITDADGRVTGVALVAERGRPRSSGARSPRTRGRSAPAPSRPRGCCSTAAPSSEPHGLGNDTTRSGRNLQGHVYAGALAMFDEPVQDCAGPGPEIATHDFRHHNDGLVGGAMIANDFVPLPLRVWTLARRRRAHARRGAGEQAGACATSTRGWPWSWGRCRRSRTRTSRVTVDPDVRDRFGVPVARLSAAASTRRTGGPPTFIAERAAEWLGPAARAHGAALAGRRPRGRAAASTRPAPAGWATTRPPRSPTPGAGCGGTTTCLADGSLHVTNGGVNPVLTILALAYRVSRRIAEEHRARAGRQLSGASGAEVGAR